MFRADSMQVSGSAIRNAAIWLTCPDCGHTTRVLALMAGRVMKERTHCLECSSTAPVCMNYSPAGRSAMLSHELSVALRETDDPALHAWVEAGEKVPPLSWLQVAQGRLLDRFSRRHSNAEAGRGRAPFAVDPAGQPLGAQDFHHAAGTISKTGSAVHL